MPRPVDSDFPAREPKGWPINFKIGWRLHILVLSLFPMLNKPDSRSAAEVAAGAGVDINLIECNLALPVEERWRQHSLALEMALELQQARIDRDTGLQSSPSSTR